MVIVMSIAASTVTWWVAADRLRSLWPHLMRPISPHERYARALKQANLHDTMLGDAWLSAAMSAIRQPQDVTLPFSATGSFDAASTAALAWRFHARRGRRIEVEIELDSSRGRVFVDLFRPDPQDREALVDWVASAPDGASALQHEPTRDGVFIVRLQPELLRGGRFRVRQRAVATLTFPVQGVTARAVQSAFGDARSGGARSHEGVDIFAARGTPALAASGGWVTSVTTNRLGGKVVWVWDAARGQALYYAHLDRQEVSPGELVKSGDVVGYVGNTGNARTTPPHLHFGIYRAVDGAIDPLPFICDAPCGSLVRDGRVAVQPD